jgi:hypothetical protein
MTGAVDDAGTPVGTGIEDMDRGLRIEDEDMRKSRIRQIIGEFAAEGKKLLDGIDVGDLLDGPDRYLLVELQAERYGRDLYLTTHPSPAAAGEYHMGQEYAEDWFPELLVDLDTGERQQPLGITWGEPWRA